MTAEQEPARRLGGELPALIDKRGAPRALPANWLAFSNGRAALAWLLDRRPIHSVALCAYTCPVLPPFFRRRGLEVGFYDVIAEAMEIADLVHTLAPPRLLLLPAMFGNAPLVDPDRMAALLGKDDIVVIDGAQSAFAQEEFAPPPGGAVFSCLRKTTALADGAILLVDGMTQAMSNVDRLPVARGAASAKAQARELWATEKSAVEKQALALNAKSETSWPDTPHRITEQSLAQLKTLDRTWHTERRRNNRATLLDRLPAGTLFWSPESGTPYCLPIFIGDPDATMTAMHKKRIFVTRLWPDSEHDAARHPAAAWIARHLIALPVDQRCNDADIARIADLANKFSAPAPAAPVQLKPLIGTKTS